MSSAQHADPTAGNAAVCLSFSAPDHLQLLQRLEVLELQTDLDAQNIAQLQEQNKQLEDALSTERARGEKHSEALMHIARTCDNRVDELKTQHAVAIVTKESTIAKLEDAAASVKAENAALRAANAALVAQVAALQAQTTSKLTDIHAAIAALQMLEIHPVRPDHRQFAEWHTGPVPALPSPPPLPLPSPASVAFDREWCSAACGNSWEVNIDATGMRAHVTKTGDSCLTVRSAAPLPRRVSLGLAPDGPHRHELPAYRVVIEACGQGPSCRLGFVPSHYMCVGAAAAAPVIPVVGRYLRAYGGWSIMVHASSAGVVDGDVKRSGWIVLKPSRGAAGDAAGDTSAYATTDEVPPVPAGSAVEFALDYAAGTCRVAFYTPGAVASGFVEAPHAKMELRFVVTAATPHIPARSVPKADSGVELYPAAETFGAGVVWRFVSL